MSKSSLVLAIDIGTSSCRSALFDEEGQRVDGTFFQNSYQLQTNREGAAELDPTTLVHRLESCLKQTLNQPLPDQAVIEGIGTSCFWHSMLGVDELGQAASPIYTWADARCANEAADLRKHHDEADYHAATGCMLRPSFWPARLRWLAKSQSGTASNIAHWWSPAEFIQSKFCDEVTVSRSMASGTGLLDVDDPYWHDESLQMAGITPEHLSPIDDTSLPLSAAIRRKYPALAEARWFPGIGDGAASNLGSGATRPGVAALNFGTSGALRIVLSDQKKVEVPNGLFHYRIDDQRRIIGGAISNAGNAREWCIENLALPNDPVTLEQAIADTPPLQHGLTVLPFLNPERSPTWNEQVTGTITGLRMHNNAIEIYTAICESTYQRMARILDLLRPLAGRKTPKIMVGGGVQKSPALLQRLGDALGAPVYPNEEREASMRGAAVFALEHLGKTIPDVTADITPIKPRPKFAKAFAHQREDLVRLEELLNNTPPFGS